MDSTFKISSQQSGGLMTSIMVIISLLPSSMASTADFVFIVWVWFCKSLCVEGGGGGREYKEKEKGL